jgi:hypothetical protein
MACHLAVRLANRYKIFKEVMRHCILELDKMNSNSKTVLHLAVIYRNQKAVKCLLQHNVDMHKRVGDSKHLKSALELLEGDKSLQWIFAKYKDKGLSK